ncbi:hypothetical protein RRG08_003181 [Elysia crispata]|uniref:Reverse transcriptase zinc-binding domain-containing protein n=1 Tax=Elysia crispata TaxID=231223 RepID=A0AAE1EBD7_9GAST|nr:hypothetical protein RRG08_003181 [Elysia crispata]
MQVPTRVTSTACSKGGADLSLNGGRCTSPYRSNSSRFLERDSDCNYLQVKEIDDQSSDKVHIHLRDSIYQLPRADQVAIFRLRTGHNRLKHHLFSRYKIVDGPNCPCGASRQDAQHILQDCPQLEEARRKYWPESREMNQKLYGSALHLGITAEFINSLDFTI